MNMNVYDKYRCIIKSAGQQASQPPAAAGNRTAKAGKGMGPSVNAYYNPDGGDKPADKCLAALTGIRNSIQLHNSPAPRELVTGELPPSPGNMQTAWVAEADRKRNLEKRAFFPSFNITTPITWIANGAHKVSNFFSTAGDLMDKGERLDKTLDEIEKGYNDWRKENNIPDDGRPLHEQVKDYLNQARGVYEGVKDVYNNRYKYMAGLGAAAVGLPALGSYMGASMAAGGQSQPQQQYNEQQPGGYSGGYNDERTEDAMLQQMMQTRNSRAAQQQRY